PRNHTQNYAPNLLPSLNPRSSSATCMRVAGRQSMYRSVFKVGSFSALDILGPQVTGSKSVTIHKGSISYFWTTRIKSYCSRMLSAVHLATLLVGGYLALSGQ